MEEFYKLDNVIISEKQLNKICDSFFETVGCIQLNDW